LSEDDEDSPEAPLPEDIGTPVDQSSSDGAETFAHEDVEEEFSAKIEDQTQLYCSFTKVVVPHTRI
jgi:hypothetical protein